MRDAESHLIDSGVRWWCKWSRCKQSVSVSFSDVGIGQGMHIHTAEYKYGGATPPPATPDGTDLFPLVCMHGFGTGLGIFYAALPALAERWRSRVYAIDSLGCGLSSRPRYSGLGQASANDEDVKQTESFFVEGIERWRAAQSIDRMVLCGHSIGGYLAVAYAERYPERVERLLLVSAVGVPAPPPELASAHAEAPFLFQMVLGAWRSGWSPFTVAKLGLGSTILRGYVHNRFSGMPVRGSNRGDDRLVCCSHVRAPCSWTDASWVAKPELQQYLLGSWTSGPNSAGGYAHSLLLQPGGVGELAYAKTPLAPRLPRLPRRLRVSALYGSHDWCVPCI